MLDPKQEKAIKNMAKNMKSMPALSLAGVLLPFILFLAAVLGLAYSGQRKTLLQQMDGQPTPEDVDTADALTYIRRHDRILYVPAITLGVYVALAVALVSLVLLSR